jgi:cation diffusion facilitator family transporter
LLGVRTSALPSTLPRTHFCNSFVLQFSSARASLLSISPRRDEAAIAGRQRVYVEAGRAALWGLGVNVTLMIVKLVGGMVTGSSALIADAVNSVGDVASALAVRGALSVAQREEDDDHPYGHTKAESIAGLAVALLVAFSATLLAMETVKRFQSELHLPGVLAGIIATICAVVKEGVYQYTRRVATDLNSSALHAVAWDHRSDALGSAVVAVSLLVAPYAGPLGAYLDPAAALGVCLLLVFSGLNIFKSTATELMDQQADDEMVARVRAVAGEVPGVVAVEKLRVRKSGLEYFIEIHVQVVGDITVDAGHRIGHGVKDELLALMPRVRDVHVHVEPYMEQHDFED